MSTPKINVLVGIDFSKFAEQALSYALKLVGPMGGSVHLGHVAHCGTYIHDTTLGPVMPDDFPEAGAARARLQQLRTELGAEVDVQIHVRLSSSPVEGLLGLIMELKPDILVVASHGKGIPMRMLMGSVSNQLALRSPIPVLIVPPPERAQLLNQTDALPEPESSTAERALAMGEGGRVF